MARIPYVEIETAAPKAKEILERLPLKLNIFKMMAHAETNFRPLVMLGTSILTEQQLSSKLRELAILRVARLSRAEYEWVQHVPIAKMTGVSDEQVVALERDDATAACFDPVDRIVLRATDEIVRDGGPSDATFVDLQAHFSNREIVELVLAVGFYMVMARLMISTRIDVDEPAGHKILASLQSGQR
jgi:alkylhydroperoxidase family enzyme